jgi:hypothetical protein
MSGATAASVLPYTSQEPLALLDARLGDVEVLREVQLEHLEGLGNVEARVCVRDQVDDHVGPIDHRLRGLPLAADVAADELELRGEEGFLELFVGEVETLHLVAGVAEQPVRQVCADEPSNPSSNTRIRCLPSLEPRYRPAGRP